MARLNLKKYFYVFIVIALLIIFHYAGPLAPAENFLSRAFKPLAGAFYSLSSGLNRAYLDQTAKAGAAERLKAAEAEAARLTAENVRLKFLEEENAVLRKNLNFLSTAGGRYLVANVVSRGEFSGQAADSQTLVIDKGSADGLYPGLPVVDSAVYAGLSRGVIIGKVMSVKERLAEVYLVTDKNCKLAAAILGQSKTLGVVRGDLGLTVKMEFIPQSEAIAAGDAVATSGLEKNVPRGLVIGRVASVDKENNQVWQSAVIEPLINLDALNIITVLLP